jgi:hypothetical protein
MMMDGLRTDGADDYADRGLEGKYALANAAAPLLLQWLRGVTAPDPEFAQGQVSSIYYDTSAFHLYAEKAHSDYIKTKARLRWYADLSCLDDATPVTCFFEVKRKVGSVRQKLRQQLTLACGDLRDPWHSRTATDIAKLTRDLGFNPPGLLQPAAIVTYSRHRFVDYVSESRISLDVDIGCPASNPHLLPSYGRIMLDEAVLEVKGKHRELIPSLLPMRHLFVKTAFSKYARCLDRLVQPMGVR